jgi:hypothetical protein
MKVNLEACVSAFESVCGISLKSVLALCLCIALKSNAAAASETVLYEHAVRTGRGSRGVSVVMVITKADWDEQPKYDPEQQAEPPLTVKEACRIARESLKAPDKEPYVGNVDAMKLKRVGMRDYGGRWAYVVSYVGQAHEFEIDVIVLMTGKSLNWIQKP